MFGFHRTDKTEQHTEPEGVKLDVSVWPSGHENCCGPVYRHVDAVTPPAAAKANPTEEIATEGSLRTDSAKLLRLGGVATSGLAVLDAGFSGIEAVIDAARDISIEPAAINVAVDGSFIALGAIMATWGANRLDRFLSRHDGQKTV